MSITFPVATPEVVRPTHRTVQWAPTNAQLEMPIPEPEPALAYHDLGYFSMVAHEIRGPLHAVAASAELLSEGLHELDIERTRRVATTIHRQTVWLQGLVENLLCAATISQGRLQLQQQPVNLLDVLTEMEVVTGPLLAACAQWLEVQCSVVAPVVLGDRRRLGQVLMNLILNASNTVLP